MSEGRYDELDIDDLMRLLHVQVLHYEREKLACRLRVCFAVQLVASGWFLVAAPHPIVASCGVLYAGTALIGFCAAKFHHVWAFLVLQSALSVVVLASTAHLLLRLSGMHLNIDVSRQPSTHQLLECFIILSGILMLLQAIILRLCFLLLCSRVEQLGSSEAEADSLCRPDGVEELSHIDLARTPPDTTRDGQ
ncbi:hypothetical protein Ctob_005731, partial [Chrysochromulina tobinii]